MQKKRKSKLFMGAVGVLIVVGITGVTLAVAPLVRTAKNAFFNSEIDIELLEPNYDKKYVSTSGENLTATIVPYQTIEKDPQVKNTCSKTEVVFLRIEVPVAAVRTETKTAAAAEVAYEVFDLTYEGGAYTTAASELASGEDAFYWYEGSVPDGTHVLTKATAPASQVEHSDDWILLSNTINYKTVSGDKVPVSREYLFGYKNKLPAGSTTAPLFDTLQLTRFIDGDASELSDQESLIDITAYAIQYDNVKLGETKLTASTFDYGTLKQLYILYGSEAAVTTG